MSEGRGTTRPFELIGAPDIKANTLVMDLNALDLPGVHFRPTTFEPTFQKYAGQTCGGCQIHVTDRRAFRPVVTGVAIIQAFRRLAGSKFAWRTTKMPIDILAGSDTLRQQIELDRNATDIAQGWIDAIESFNVLRQRYLLY